MRRARALARRDTVAKILIDALRKPNAPSYPVVKKARKSPRHVAWRPIYGSFLAIVPAKNTILDADGKPTQFDLVRQWTHQPGEIVESKQRRRTGEQPRRYIVQTNHSLVTI
jgi:hypothetical protein